MRFYGTIETNLMEEYIKQGIDYSTYSVDSLLFETGDGEEFRIDFEEADYAIESEYITFRLKSLGITFREDWDDLTLRDRSIEMEQDVELFKRSKLKEIYIYLGDVLDQLESLKFESTESYLQIGNEDIHYKGVIVDAD